MIYNLSKNIDQQRFAERVQHLSEKKCRVELTEKRERRSLNQNNYLHLILSWYGLELGYTLKEVKQDIFKRDICKEYFERQKKGRTVYRSTADLNTKEMTEAIEKFRDHASKDAGIYLPAPDEQEFIDVMQNEIERFGNKKYL